MSSLFYPAADLDSGSDRALIDAAIERTLDGTDRRLRALGDYRKRLRDPVSSAVQHVTALVDGLPAAAEISRPAFGTDSRVRAFFSSVEHLQQVLGGFKNVRNFLETGTGLPPDEIFGLLIMDREERTVLGTELEGDAVRRDVMQVAVNFCHHRYLTPTATESDTRLELKKRAFDYLIGRALERLTAERVKRGDLEQQRRLLRRKLDAMNAGDWGLGSMLKDQQEGLQVDVSALEAEIESIDAELGRFGTSALSLEQSLAQIACIMARPADWLASRQICLQLDYRGIKRSDSPAASSPEIELTELFSVSGIRKSVLLGRIPRAEIPPRVNPLKQAGHYLA